MNDLPNAYYDRDKVSAAIDAGEHRDIIGGKWDELGELQFQTLVKFGLTPAHSLIDVGCGSLRGGTRFVRYLDSGNYFGLDLNESLLEAGYQKEIIPEGLSDRLPRTNLIADSEFDFSRFDRSFDFALGFSLFTHLPLDTIRSCLEQLCLCMADSGVFLATFFEAEPTDQTHAPKTHAPGGITTFGGKDPYHHCFDDFVYLAKDLPWAVTYVGEFGHSRGQRLIKFEKVSSKADASDMRGLPVEKTDHLAPGDDHYRAYVGPPSRFDYISASQFSLLFQLGLKDTHSVLDFGCGSLRLGRLLIPFLRSGNYAGIDPNAWLIDEGIDRELGRSAIDLKRPQFAYNDDFDCTVFAKSFDFIIAQSIVTHTGPDQMRAMFGTINEALNETGLFLFSYIRNSDEQGDQWPADGWHYPQCVGYTDHQLVEELSASGVFAKPVHWFHPGASWMIAGISESVLPTDEELRSLTGQTIHR